MPKTVEQLYRPPSEQPIDPDSETMSILQALDANPLLARDFLRLESPLDIGEYSYVLTLHSAIGERSSIRLSLIPLEIEDIFEQEWVLTDKRKRDVSKQWGERASLLRFGELAITDASFTERRGSELSSLSDLAMHVVLQTHGNGRVDNLGFQDF